MPTLTAPVAEVTRKPHTIDELLREAVSRDASDIIISAGSPITYHVYGRLEFHDENHRLSPKESRALAYALLNDDQRLKFERDLDGDMSLELFDVARFRANVYQQRGSVSAVLRHVPLEIPHHSKLGISDMLMTRLTNIPNGLILVTGPTGSGKSTTLASYLEFMNSSPNYAKHIVTIEDPIEFRMRSRHCVIDQREVGTDVHDYSTGLRAALRQMAHVIFVGEMRDRATIEIALTAAETGNVVVSTLATQSSAKTINRIIDVFPVHDQDEVRTRLALTLKCVISQVLLPHRSGQGRVAAREVLFVTNPVANQIREGKIHMINNVISSSSSDGMSLLDDSLLQLYRDGVVDAATIMPRFQDPEKARQVVRG
ncbi:PilT/PilU family type 4a pilus ATPase [bacterium]|nr:PilT/PilU family type 4a pilus ATPase [bacterium]